MKKEAFLLCLIVSVGLASCESKSPGELRGQIFVVTEGAVNLKLGLVEVTAIPEKEVLESIAMKTAQVAGIKAGLKKEYELAEKAYQVANDEVLQDIRLALTAHDDDFSPVEGGRSDVRRGQLRWERRASSEKHLAERELAMDALVDAKLKYEMFPSAAYFFNGLPEGIASATTDADGNFLLTVSRKSRYVLAAHSSRRVLENKEEYHWLENVSLDGAASKSVVLNNNNLFKPDLHTLGK